MEQIRITKYNPIYRNELGHYLLRDWTCPTEVGKSFAGVRFKKRDYFEVEKKYIDSILCLFNSSGLDHLRIVNLEKKNLKRSLFDKKYAWLVEPGFKTISLFEDRKVNEGEIGTLIKLILRDFIWCKLEVDREFFVHFGYDYYMWLGTNKLLERDVISIENSGLFVESLDSPHHSENHLWKITIGKKGQPFVEQEIEMDGVTPDFIRKSLNLSSEHPGNHNFIVSEENHAAFAGFANFDFEANDYFVCCDGQ